MFNAKIMGGIPILNSISVLVLATVLGIRIFNPPTTSNTDRIAVFENTKDSVVLISLEVPADPLKDNLVHEAEGTGFFISLNIEGKNKLVIITNNHVVDHAGSGPVKIKSRDSSKQYGATIFKSDAKADVAILIPSDDYLKDHPNLVPLILDLNRDLKPGEDVFAIGHPFGFEYSITSGIVNSIDRFGFNGGGSAFVIQTDTEINPGNSGGPLFNGKGEVVGVNEFIFDPHSANQNAMAGYGFSIPSILLEKYINNLILNKENQWGSLDVSLSVQDNLVVSDTSDPKGAALTAGIQVGDKLTNIKTKYTSSEGKSLDGILQLKKELTLVNPGDTVLVSVLRNGKTIQYEVTPTWHPWATKVAE